MTAAGQSKHVTLCTVCDRIVGAAQSWDRTHLGLPGPWRVSRHAAVPLAGGHKPPRRPICAGGGIEVPEAVVLDNREAA